MIEMLKKQNIDIDNIHVGRGHRNPKIVSDYLLLSSYLPLFYIIYFIYGLE